MINHRRISLDEAMKFIGAYWTGSPHILFDPKLKPQYEIRRQSAHDGTLLFSMELIRDAMMPLFSRESFYKPMGEFSDKQIPEYTIGAIRVIGVYGQVNVPAGRIHGMRERVIIPVQCRYVNI